MTQRPCAYRVRRVHGAGTYQEESWFETHTPFGGSRFYNANLPSGAGLAGGYPTPFSLYNFNSPNGVEFPPVNSHPVLMGVWHSEQFPLHIWNFPLPSFNGGLAVGIIPTSIPTQF